MERKNQDCARTGEYLCMSSMELPKRTRVLKRPRVAKIYSHLLLTVVLIVIIYVQAQALGTYANRAVSKQYKQRGSTNNYANTQKSDEDFEQQQQQIQVPENEKQDEEELYSRRPSAIQRTGANLKQKPDQRFFARDSRSLRSASRGQQTRPVFAASQSVRQVNRPADDSTKCALILQRTYVKRTGDDDYGDVSLGNTAEAIGAEGSGKQERVCITYEDVDKAIAEAKRRRKFTSVPKEEIDSIEPSPPVIAELGELNQEVTRLLAVKFDLSPDEILNGLPLIDMSRTSFWPLCPLMVRPVNCDPQGRFRSFTGHCNNLKNPSWGAAQTPFVRFLTPKHPDGIHMDRVSVVDGSPLPSPRLVTSIVHRDHDQPSGDLSLLIMVWGQIIDHDVALAAPPRGKYLVSRNKILHSAISDFWKSKAANREGPVLRLTCEYC